MAGLNFTSDELARCKHWYKNIFMPASHGNDGANKYIYNDLYYVIEACKKILNVILERTFDMQVGGNIDQAFQTLARTRYIKDPDGDRYESENQYTLTADLIARFLAYICFLKKIYWNDGEHTAQELAYFTKTKLGKALSTANCFASQQTALMKQAMADAEKPINLNTNTTQASRTRAASTSATNLGGNTGNTNTLNLQNCGGLVTGQKEDLSNEYKVYKIQGFWSDPSKKTNPKVFVSPQNQPSPVKAKLGSGQGPVDCVLFWKDRTEAEKVMNAVISSPSYDASKIASLPVVAKNPYKGGYFRIHTNLGDAYIQANDLGE